MYFSSSAFDFNGFCKKLFHFHLVMMMFMTNLVISCDQAIADEAHTWRRVPYLQTEGVTEQSVWQASLQTWYKTPSIHPSIWDQVTWQQARHSVSVLLLSTKSLQSITGQTRYDPSCQSWVYHSPSTHFNLPRIHINRMETFCLNGRTTLVGSFSIPLKDLLFGCLYLRLKPFSQYSKLSSWVSFVLRLSYLLTLN